MFVRLECVRTVGLLAYTTRKEMRLRTLNFCLQMKVYTGSYFSLCRLHFNEHGLILGVYVYKTYTNGHPFDTGEV